MSEESTDFSPKTKILFVAEDNSPEAAEAALGTGARGYVVKSDAGRELLPAVEAVLRGERFVSSSLPLSLKEKAEKGVEEN